VWSAPWAALFWSMLFGYHIIILAIPDTRPWIAFKLYTIGLLVIKLAALLETCQASLLTVRVTATSLSIDGRDFTPLLGKSDLGILGLNVNNHEHRPTVRPGKITPYGAISAFFWRFM